MFSDPQLKKLLSAQEPEPAGKGRAGAQDYV